VRPMQDGLILQRNRRQAGASPEHVIVVMEQCKISSEVDLIILLIVFFRHKSNAAQLLVEARVQPTSSKHVSMLTIWVCSPWQGNL